MGYHLQEDHDASEDDVAWFPWKPGGPVQAAHFRL